MQRIFKQCDTDTMAMEVSASKIEWAASFFLITKTFREQSLTRSSKGNYEIHPARCDTALHIKLTGIIVVTGQWHGRSIQRV